MIIYIYIYLFPSFPIQPFFSPFNDHVPRPRNPSHWWHRPQRANETGTFEPRGLLKMSCVWPWWSLTGSKGGTGDWKYWTSWMVQHGVVEIEWVGGIPGSRRHYSTTPNHALVKGKALKVAIHLHCSIPSQNCVIYMMTPVSWRCHMKMCLFFCQGEIKLNFELVALKPWLELSTASPIRWWRQRMTATTMKKRTPSLISHLSLLAKTKQRKSVGESRFCAGFFWAFRWNSSLCSGSCRWSLRKRGQVWNCL